MTRSLLVRCSGGRSPPDDREARKEAGPLRQREQGARPTPGEQTSAPGPRSHSGPGALYEEHVRGQRSRMATTPWPPAAQVEIRPRPLPPFSASSLASTLTIRPPVAANGWPAASEEPLTFSLARSIEPSGASRPRRSLQNTGSSHAFSVE